jgi:hypothetical protein
LITAALGIRKYRKYSERISATHRITKTIVKTHPFQATCKHECAMIFRQHDGKGNQRLKPTLSKEILLANFDLFVQKWKHISVSLPENPILRKSFEKETENLRKHNSGMFI